MSIYDGKGNTSNINVDITVSEIVKVSVFHHDAIPTHRPEKKGASSNFEDDDSATLATIYVDPERHKVDGIAVGGTTLKSENVSVVTDVGAKEATTISVIVTDGKYGIATKSQKQKQPRAVRNPTVGELLPTTEGRKKLALKMTPRYRRTNLLGRYPVPSLIGRKWRMPRRTLRPKLGTFVIDGRSLILLRFIVPLLFVILCLIVLRRRTTRMTCRKSRL